MNEVKAKACDAGFTPGRKIKAFLWVVFSICAFVYLVTKIRTPDPIAIQGINLIGAAGLFAIGGQALVDSFEKWALSKSGSTVQRETNISETVKTP